MKQYTFIGSWCAIHRTLDQPEPGLLAWALVDNLNDNTVWLKNVHCDYLLSHPACLNTTA
jgi:hypothetical protein